MKMVRSNDENVTVLMTREELRTLIHAMSEVTLTSVIAKGEFFTRLGVTRAQADKMLDDLSAIWKTLRGTSHAG